MDRQLQTRLGEVFQAEAIRPVSSWSWGLRSTSASLTGDRVLGGVAAVLIIGEKLEEDVALDCLHCPLDNFRLESGGQATAVVLVALDRCASEGPVASPAGPGNPSGCRGIQEQLNRGGHGG